MSVSIIDKSVFGNKRVNVISYVASGAEDNITTGLDYVDHFSVGIKSCATSAYSMHENVDSSGTASNGGIGVSGVASGDYFFIYAYGR
jgi:hypothetical protein